jgi:transcriptional regulator with XRE-family HTH domain
MPSFRLADTIGLNIVALRHALGSVRRELSRDGLAELLSEGHPTRRLGGSTIARWERGDTEPDLHSLRVMAALAGVTPGQFAYGPGGDRMPSPEVEVTRSEIAAARTRVDPPIRQPG